MKPTRWIALALLNLCKYEVLAIPDIYNIYPHDYTYSTLRSRHRLTLTIPPVWCYTKIYLLVLHLQLGIPPLLSSQQFSREGGTNQRRQRYCPWCHCQRSCSQSKYSAKSCASYWLACLPTLPPLTEIIFYLHLDHYFFFAYCSLKHWLRRKGQNMIRWRQRIKSDMRSIVR